MVDSAAKKIAILEELNAIHKKRIDLLQKDYQLVANKLADTRQLLKAGNDAKRTLLEELEASNERYTNLEAAYNKKVLSNYTKNFFAYAGLPLGLFAGWGIRDLHLFLHKK